MMGILSTMTRYSSCQSLVVKKHSVLIPGNYLAVGMHSAVVRPPHASVLMSSIIETAGQRLLCVATSDLYLPTSPALLPFFFWTLPKSKTPVFQTQRNPIPFPSLPIPTRLILMSPDS
jgi:hypothetical protein